jgi:methionine-rich copper-binding protein CopC
VFALSLILIMLIGFFSASSASAHTRLVNTTPADGAKLPAVPVVSLTFSDDVLKLGAAIKVIGPAGVAQIEAVDIKGKTLSWPLSAGLANGRYVVNWRVTAQDGHPIDGTFDFVLRAPVQPTEAPSPTAPAAPTVTPHVAEPEMTGAMPGMVGMPASRPAPANSTPVTGLAIAGLLLLTVAVVAAIVMENRRRPRPAANPSGTASD